MCLSCKPSFFVNEEHASLASCEIYGVHITLAKDRRNHRLHNQQKVTNQWSELCYSVPGNVMLDTRINTLSFSFISPFQCKANRFNKEWRFVALCSGSRGHKKSITLFSDVLFHALHYAFLLISITKCTCYNWNPEYRNHDLQVHLPQGNHHKHPLQRTWKSELHRTWECQLP